MAKGIKSLSLRTRKAISIAFFSAICAGEIALAIIASYLLWKYSPKDTFELAVFISLALPVFLILPAVTLKERIHIVLNCTDKV